MKNSRRNRAAAERDANAPAPSSYALKQASWRRNAVTAPQGEHGRAAGWSKPPAGHDRHAH